MTEAAAKDESKNFWMVKLELEHEIWVPGFGASKLYK